MPDLSRTPTMGLCTSGTDAGFLAFKWGSSRTTTDKCRIYQMNLARQVGTYIAPICVNVCRQDFLRAF